MKEGLHQRKWPPPRLQQSHPQIFIRTWWFSWREVSFVPPSFIPVMPRSCRWINFKRRSRHLLDFLEQPKVILTLSEALALKFLMIWYPSTWGTLSVQCSVGCTYFLDCNYGYQKRNNHFKQLCLFIASSLLFRHNQHHREVSIFLLVFNICHSWTFWPPVWPCNENVVVGSLLFIISVCFFYLDM